MHASPAPVPLRTVGQDGEVPFDFDEIFFSRTDARGVIRAGNATFRRVSGFPWERLIGAPHRIVRHPGTPRGLFHLLWERIKAGKPTCAYVRNRSDDGRSYWVIAVVVPLDDGYLSVRIKPGSDCFRAVRGHYEDLLAYEANGATPAESSARLLDRIGAAGSASYDIFQAKALAQEVLHRASRIGRTGPESVARFSAVRDAMLDIEREIDVLGDMFDDARLVSTNLRILAMSLGDIGRPVSAISINYSLLAEDMSQWLEARALDSERGFAAVRQEIVNGLFLTAAAEILVEMAQAFSRHRETGGSDAEGEVLRLEEAAGHFRTRSDEVIPRMFRAARSLDHNMLEMRRHVTGLSSIRMLCRVEGAALGARGGSLDQIVDQLNEHQDRLEACLRRIASANQRLQHEANGLRSQDVRQRQVGAAVQPA